MTIIVLRSGLASAMAQEVAGGLAQKTELPSCIVTIGSGMPPVMGTRMSCTFDLARHPFLLLPCRLGYGASTQQ